MRATLLFFSFLFCGSLLFGQAQRRVMVESFTQASCGPCAAQNPGFNQLLANNRDKVAVLKYQTSGPGYDPMNLDNPGDVQVRANYYGISVVPTVYLGGTLNAGIAANVNATQINNIYNQLTPLEMELSQVLSEGLDSIYLTGVIRNLSDEVFNPANTFLRVAILEQEILYSEPPGSTSETDFYNVMRKMLPNANGTRIDSISAGDSLLIDMAAPIPSYIFSLAQVGAVAFVQTNGSREIHQSAFSEGPGFFADLPDLGLSTQSGPAGYCVYEVTPSVTVTNDGQLEVTEMEIGMSLNGGATVSQSWSGSLPAGASETITFEEVAVTSGISNFDYELLSINGGLRDYNRINDEPSPQTFYTVSADPVGTAISEGFEETANLAVPENTLIVRDNGREFGVVTRPYLQGLGATVPAAVGGYADSEKSIMVDFYTWSEVGDQAYFLFEKTDLTAGEGTYLAFDHAHAQYPFSNFTTQDRLQVQVSNDCGTTWSVVYDERGSSLSTRTPTTSFFAPSSSQWASDTISLSAFDGSSELLVRFTAISDYGNSLYIDNIRVEENTVSRVDEAGMLEGKVFAYPNPASELVNIDFHLSESSRVDITVFDASGKRVEAIVGGQQYPSGAHKALWEPQRAGFYLIRIATEQGAVTKRVTVTR